MFKQLLSAVGLAPKKPLLSRKWLSSESNDSVTETIVNGEVRSVLSTGTFALAESSMLANAIQGQLAKGNGMVLIDSAYESWLPVLTKIIHKLDRDADLEVVYPDEQGLYPSGLSACRAQHKILVIAPPSQPMPNAPMRERNLSNLIVELIFDSSQEGFEQDTAVLVNDVAYGMRESILSSLLKQSSRLPYQVILHVPDIRLAEARNPKLYQHLVASADACVSKKKRIFTTDRALATPVIATCPVLG